MTDYNRILVTGTQRSGGTWVGRVLSSNGQFGYIHEPFNNLNKKVHQSPIKWPYEYIDEYKDEKQGHIYSDYLNYFSQPSLRFLSRSIRHAHKVDSRYVLPGIQFVRNAFTRKKQIIKDPFALVSSEWLYKNLDWKIVIIVRHPAAFALSMKEKSWLINPNGLHHCKAELKERLGGKAQVLEEYFNQKNRQEDYIGSAIKGWQILTTLISYFKRTYPDWIVLRHEDLSMQPMELFSTLFKKLDISFNDKARSFISESTSGVHLEGNIRNSKDNVKKWKNKLSPSEISRIKAETLDIWTEFYSENDW